MADYVEEKTITKLITYEEVQEPEVINDDYIELRNYKRESLAKALKANKDPISCTLAAASLGLVGDICLTYFNGPSWLPLVFNLIYLVDMIYFTGLAYSAINKSYKYYMKNYEDSLV